MRKTLIGLAAAALLAIGCTAAPDDPAVSPDVAADAGVPTATPAPKDGNTITAGTWKVGGEVKPGTYLTEGVGINCYWARLRNFDGQLTSIIANGNLQEGQRGRITVKKGDAGLELNGDCVWVRDRK